MKRSIFAISLISICLISCAKKVDEDAILLLEKSAAAHGGVNKWDEISSIKFQKWTQLLDSTGTIESETDQLQEFRLKPYFEAKISWMVDGLLHVSSWDGQKMRYTIGENEVLNEDFLEQKKADIDAAYYVLAQPWKLMQDPNANFKYLGERAFAGELLTLAIQVDYGPDSDIWWYYFDPLTYLIVGNEVLLKDHRSLIANGPPALVEDMYLHDKRTSYRVDDQGKKLYVRARYEYYNYQITFE